MHEEEGETQYDISKLQYQDPQISLSQRVSKKEMQARMDGLNNCLK